MLTDSIFWFSQPSFNLINYDKYLFWLFAVLVAGGIVMKVVSIFSGHVVILKLINKFSNSFLWMGIIGLIWFAMRYENAPIFAYRLWAATVIAIWLIWLAFIFKYWFTDFRSEKKDYDRLQLNSRYIPGSR